MKLKITMKDPDALYDSVAEAVAGSIEPGTGSNALTDAEIEQLVLSREESAIDLCRRWFGYGEYLTVEIDTELMTCTVLEAKR